MTLQLGPTLYRPPAFPAMQAIAGLDELRRLVAGDPITLDQLEPLVQVDPDHYVRIVLHRDAVLETALLCFAEGQTSTVHDHQGSACVIRVLRGALHETLFEGRGSRYAAIGSRSLGEGDISGLTGWQVHQICNVARGASVLLNYYSPPFDVPRMLRAPAPPR